MVTPSRLLSCAIDVVLISIATLVICLLVYLATTWRRYKYWTTRRISQSPPSFPCGNFANVLCQRQSIGEFLHELYRSSNEDLLGFYIFHTPSLLIRSPDVVRNILVTDFGSFQDRIIASDERADSISSKLLLLVKNPEWKIMRQKVSPTFTSSKIRAMTGHVIKSADDLVAFLTRKYSEGPVEAKEACAKFATDVITSCAFGVEANSFRDEDAPFRVTGRKFVETTFINGLRFMTYFLVPQAVGWFRVPFFDRKAMAFLKDAFLETINLREGVPEEGRKKRGDLIDIIIELKKNPELPGGILFEGDRIVAQAVQFFAAGFETNSATISFALYELALNPEVQEKARQNVKDLLQEGGSIDYDGVLKLQYLEYVIYETLRKYPSLPFLDRRCNKDFQIEGSSKVIPAGTPVYIPVIGLHYDERYFPNPEKFDPERFQPEEVKKRHQFTFLPFGKGPHNCLGERFAMNAVKICIAKLLLEFRLEPCKETQVPIRFSPRAFPLIAQDGITLTFKKL